MKKFSIFAAIIVIIVLLGNLSTLIAHFEKYVLDRNKEVTTETKVLTKKELLDLGMQQMHSTVKLESTIRYSLVGKESRHGLDELWNTYDFFMNHPTITSIKISLPITSYKAHNQTITFVSGKGKILEVLVNGEWKDYKNA